jgi:hypothetical protein
MDRPGQGIGERQLAVPAGSGAAARPASSGGSAARRGSRRSSYPGRRPFVRPNWYIRDGTARNRTMNAASGT